jgi:steroid delta-isomerase-like uncharacterized protein
MTTEANKLIAQQYTNELWNRGDLFTADTIMAADFIEHIPFPGQEPGREGYKQFVSQFRAAFPDVQFTVEDLIAEGDKVTLRWSGQGTHKAELAGISATGKSVTITGIDIFRIVAGQIVERWGERNTLALMQQLGAIPT